MRAIGTVLTSAIAIGLLAGSAVGVAAQDEVAPESLPPPDEWPFPIMVFTQDGVRF